MKKARQKKEKEIVKLQETHSEEHHDTEEGGEEPPVPVEEHHSTESHEGDKIIYQNKMHFPFITNKWFLHMIIIKARSRIY